MHKAFIWEFRHRLCRDENVISKSYANTLIASSGADPGCLGCVAYLIKYQCVWSSYGFAGEHETLISEQSQGKDGCHCCPKVFAQFMNN